MSYADGLDGERADGEPCLGFNFDQLGLIEQLVLFELVFHVGQRELGAVNRNLQLVQDPGQPSDVVLVAVREHDGPNVLLVFDQVGDVGHHNVHAEQLGFGKHQARVNHNNVIFPAHGQAVHTELAQPTQGNDLQLFCLHRSISMLPPAGVRRSAALAAEEFRRSTQGNTFSRQMTACLFDDFLADDFGEGYRVSAHCAARMCGLRRRLRRVRLAGATRRKSRLPLERRPSQCPAPSMRLLHTKGRLQSIHYPGPEISLEGSSGNGPE